MQVRAAAALLVSAGATLLTVLACTSIGGLSGGDDTEPDAVAETTVGDAPTEASGCPTGFADCDGNPRNGCETKIEDNPSHCGFCGNACPARANGYPLCGAGKCTVGCNDGFASCDGDDANGCEKPVSTDSANCGACKHDCLGAACIANLCAPVQLASGQGTVKSIAVNATAVFWAGASVVMLPGKAPGAQSVLQTNTTSQYNGLAVTDTDVYWSAGDGYACSLPACTPRRIVADTLTGASTGGVTVDAARVYYGLINGLSDGRVVSVPRDAGAVSGDAGDAATPFLQHVTGQPFVIGLAVDADQLFFAATTKNRISSAPKGIPNAGVTLLASGGDARTFSIAVSADHIFWAAGSGKVLRCPKAGCADAATTMNAAADTPFVVATDGTHVYWAANGTASNGFTDGAIKRCPVAGCGTGPLVLAKGQLHPSAIALDATHVYWANENGGTIFKVAK